MAVRLVRIAALILLAIGTIDIAQAQSVATACMDVAECASLAGAAAAPASCDDCDGCASCEAVVSLARLARLPASLRGPAAVVERPQPGISPAPYHPPR